MSALNNIPPLNSDKLTFLALIQQACGELGIRQPTSIIGNNDNQVIQLLALAQREGREFYSSAHRAGGWQELRGQYIFNLLPSVTADPFSGTPFTANITAGSNIITNVSPNLGSLVIEPVSPLVSASNSGIPYDNRLVSFGPPNGTDLTKIIMDNNATTSGTGVNLTFYYDAYALPSDFGYFMTQTQWDRSFRWQLLGPLEAQEWQVLKSGISPTGPRRRCRIMGNLIYIDPPPTQAEIIVFEYYKRTWCQNTGASVNPVLQSGTPQASWVSDTDFYTLDDDAFIMGIKWRFKAAKGLDYEQEKQDYDLRCERLMARNGSNRDLPLNATASGVRLLNSDNVPDTGYGS